MFPAVSDGNNISALCVKSCNLRRTIRKYKTTQKASAHNWRQDCASLRIESITLVSCKVKGPTHWVTSLICVSLDFVPREKTCWNMLKTRDLHIKMTPRSSWDECLLTGSWKIIVALKKTVTLLRCILTKISGKKGKNCKCDGKILFMTGWLGVF